MIVAYMCNRCHLSVEKCWNSADRCLSCTLLLVNVYIALAVLIDGVLLTLGCSPLELENQFTQDKTILQQGKEIKKKQERKGMKRQLTSPKSNSLQTCSIYLKFAGKGIAPSTRKSLKKWHPLGWTGACSSPS